MSTCLSLRPVHTRKNSVSTSRVRFRRMCLVHMTTCACLTRVSYGTTLRLSLDCNSDLEDSHVIPGLIHQCYLAKKNGTPFTVSGTGKPLRQFIYWLNCLFGCCRSTTTLSRSSCLVRRQTPILIDASVVIGEDEEVSIKEVVDAYIAKEIGIKTRSRDTI